LKLFTFPLFFKVVSKFSVFFQKMGGEAHKRGWFTRGWGGGGEAEGFGLPTASWGWMMMSILVSSFPLFSANVLT